jgi:hypothetical protein
MRHGLVSIFGFNFSIGLSPDLNMKVKLNGYTSVYFSTPLKDAKFHNFTIGKFVREKCLPQLKQQFTFRAEKTNDRGD